jgi:HD-GYP domain-containing protein (c-di-GMP phosphodiesterase class II)
MPLKFSDALSGPVETSQQEELALQKRQVRKSYAHTLNSIKAVARKLTSNQSVGMRNTVRLVQKMVDLITNDESLFLEISTLRIYDDYTYIHSLNVSILSMCLGKRIGLTHKLLERLGLCGLFHDLGKAEIPKEILNKKGALNPAEFNELKNHSMHSARLILRLKAERDRKVRLLVPPFEHHIGYDHSGYPQIDARRNLSLFGRILTITDVYDAITSPRIYRPFPMSPDRALGQMLSQSGTHFDPILLKVFINMMGTYPVGTLLKFDNREMGLVTPSIDRTDPSRPMVQLLVSQPDGTFIKGNVVDLAARDPQTGGFQRTITESLHPSVLGIQPAQFLLA